MLGYGENQTANLPRLPFDGEAVSRNCCIFGRSSPPFDFALLQDNVKKAQSHTEFQYIDLDIPHAANS